MIRDPERVPLFLIENRPSSRSLGRVDRGALRAMEDIKEGARYGVFRRENRGLIFANLLETDSGSPPSLVLLFEACVARIRQAHGAKRYRMHPTLVVWAVRATAGLCGFGVP